MRNIKRWLAGLLVISLILNTGSVSVLAKETDSANVKAYSSEEKSQDNAEAVQSDTDTTTDGGQGTQNEEKSNSSVKDTDSTDENTEDNKNDTVEKSNQPEEKTPEVETPTPTEEPQAEEAATYALEAPKGVSDLHAEVAFGTMCTDIFGTEASSFVTEDAADYSTASYREIYIASSRAEELSAPLGSSQKPYTSLEEAYRTETGIGTKGVIIHLIGDYSADSKEFKGYNEAVSTWPQYALKSIIVSDTYDTISLEMSGAEWSLPENTGFYRVQVKLSYGANDDACIFANGHTAVFGGYGQDNFNFNSDDSTRNYPVLFGASSASSGAKSSHSSVGQTLIKVYGGTWRQIFGGGQYFSDVAGDATTIIDGYIEANGSDNYGGAVKFQYKRNQKLPFGYYQVYGGGAAQRTSTNEEEYSHIQNTFLSLSHVEINGSITPSGGFISGNAILNMEWCNNSDSISGSRVNARAEGNAPQKVEFNLKHVIQKSTWVSIGSVYVGDFCNYAIWEKINDFDINIEDSNVGTVSLKYSGTSGNAVDHVDVKIKDSTIAQLNMGALWADTSNGRINSITLDNVIIKSKPGVTGGSLDFKEFGTLTLKNMGSQETPFEMKDDTWGKSSKARYSPEKLILDNSYVKFEYNYQIGKLQSTNSVIELADNIEVNVNDSYENTGDKSQIVLNPSATLILNGTVAGTAAKIKANLSKEGQRAEVLWDGGDSKKYFNFADDLDNNYSTEAKVIQTMTYWSVRYGKNTGTYVYVDGENGHDKANEYGNACTDDKLGYDNTYPVKTLDKAYELVKDKNTKIILCGNYIFDFSEKNVLDFLSSNATKKDYQVIISSDDGSTDYRIASAFLFRGATKTSFLNLNGSFRFENLRLKNEEEQNKFILCNGFETYVDKGVAIEDCSTTTHYMGILGGSKDSGVTSTYLEVYNADWSYIGASGYGKDSYVGSGDKNDVSKDIIAYLKADLNYERNGAYQYTNSLCTKVIYQGTTYGSVKTDLNLQEDFLRIYYAEGNDFREKAGIVYGNFTTITDASDNVQHLGVKVCPDGITVKGTVVYSDNDSEIDYDILSIPNATFNDAEVTCNMAQVNGSGNIQLFNAETNFKNIEWNISGNKKINVYAADTNNAITTEDAKVTVNVENVAGTYRAAAQNENDYTKGFIHNKNIKLILNNFQNKTLDKISGFGSVEFSGAGSNILNSEIHTEELTVRNKANITAYGLIELGESEKNTGKLSVKNGATLKLQNSFNLYGDMEGETDNSKESGTLINNWSDENETAKKIVVSGTVSGKSYYTTDYETAEIQVKGKSTGSEYDVPPARADGSMSYRISCNPSSGSEAEGRIWTVNNFVSRKYIYVNGSLNTDDPAYERHDGSTPDLAYATIREAYGAVLKNGYIVICGDTEVSSWPENATKKVTITSKITLPNGQEYDFYNGDQKAQLKIAAELLMRTDTSFEYLNIYNLARGKGIIAANGYQLVMGHPGDKNSLVTDSADMGYDISVAGGSCFNNDVPDGKNVDIEVYAGKYDRIVAGNYVYGSVSTYSYFHPEKIVFNIANVEAQYIKFDDDHATEFDKVSSCDSKIEDTVIKKGL